MALAFTLRHTSQASKVGRHERLDRKSSVLLVCSVMLAPLRPPACQFKFCSEPPPPIVVFPTAVVYTAVHPRYFLSSTLETSAKHLKQPRSRPKGANAHTAVVARMKHVINIERLLCRLHYISLHTYVCTCDTIRCAGSTSITIQTVKLCCITYGI